MYKEVKAVAGNVQVAQGAVVVGARQAEELGERESALAHAKITIERKVKRTEGFLRMRTVKFWLAQNCHRGDGR